MYQQGHFLATDFLIESLVQTLGLGTDNFYLTRWASFLAFVTQHDYVCVSQAPAFLLLLLQTLMWLVSFGLYFFLATPCPC